MSNKCQRSLKYALAWCGGDIDEQDRATQGGETKSWGQFVRSRGARRPGLFQVPSVVIDFPPSQRFVFHPTNTLSQGLLAAEFVTQILYLFAEIFYQSISEPRKCKEAQ